MNEEAHGFAVRIILPKEIQSVGEATGVAEAIASQLPAGFKVDLLETWVGRDHVPVGSIRVGAAEPGKFPSVLD